MKTAIVTGGSGDIGVAIAKGLLEDGYTVGLLDIDEKSLKERCSPIGAIPLVADVTNEEDVKNVINSFGMVPDLLVNNAGIGRFESLLNMPIETFRHQLDVNLVGAFICARTAAKKMIQRGSGIILNITSINAITVGPGTGSYPASKAGLVKLTEMMALEWGGSGIRVNAIAPGFIDAGISTPFYKDPSVRKLRGDAVPTKRLGLAEDIANAVLFLSDPKSSYINGHHLVVDGGVSISLLNQLPRAK